MYDTEGALLREAWKASGQSHCPHTHCALERSFGGVATGYSLCRICGIRLTVLHSRAESAVDTRQSNQLLQPMNGRHLERSQWNHRRASARLVISKPIMLERTGRNEQGLLLNVSIPGCGVESPMSVSVGEYVSLRLFVFEEEAAIFVSRAIVRWVNHLRFGLEFLSWEDTERRRLTGYIGTGLGANIREACYGHDQTITERATPASDPSPGFRHMSHP